MAFEYAFVWVGADNARPWGTKAEGYVQAPHLQLADRGIDLVNIVIEAGEETGNGNVLSVDTPLTAGKWIGAELYLGTIGEPKQGHATVRANTTGTITVDWTQPANTGTFVGYLVRPEGKWAEYPQVRVLTPYQPEPLTLSTDIDYPAGTPDVPGFAFPSSITAHEDAGLFLPFTFKEGIASHGITEATDSYISPVAHAADSATATTFVLAAGAGANLVTNTFVNGFIRVDHDGGQSWARIASNTASTFTLDSAGWQGDGTPSGTAGNWTFEAWVPHYDNNPHSYLPGEGFRYPNNDLQPAVFGDGRILHRPRGIFSSSYTDRFGAMLEFGWRMSLLLGQRVNIIPLGVNDASLTTSNDENTSGFQGTLGWWDYTKHGDFSPSTSDGLAARLEKMIATMAPAALTAEGSTDSLRILGIVSAFGEPDAEIAAAREDYASNLDSFIQWLRGVIEDSGLSPYDAQAEIPVVHPEITAVPWEGTGFDSGGLINQAINQRTASHRWFADIDTSSSPKISGDNEHFNGVGEALNGALIANQLAALIDDGLAFGSEIVDEDRHVLDICNLALSHIGEAANITSLDPAVDDTEEARLCARFYPQARDSLLQMRNWGFALRRISPVKSSTDPPDPWLFSYIVPGDVLEVISVLPPGASDDYSVAGVDQTQPFTIERALEGHLVLYTDQDDAVMRYLVHVVDASRYTTLFRQALAWKLAMMLAGSIIKGEPGAQMANRAGQMMSAWLGEAAQHDASQRQIPSDPKAPWMQAR